MGDNQREGTIKAILLGESMVGKTALMKRIISNTFEETISTNGPSSNKKKIKINVNTQKHTV